MAEGRKLDRSQRSQQRAAEKRRRAATRQVEAYWKTPAGEARLAYERGDSLFELVATPFSMQGHVSSVFGTFAQRKTFGMISVLTSIERAGWRLEHAGYAFVGGTAASRDKLLTSQQQYATTGSVRGFYLFRRVEDGVRQIAPLDVLAAVNELEKVTGQVSVQFPEMRDPDVRSAFDEAEAQAGDLLMMSEDDDAGSDSAAPPPNASPEDRIF